VAGGRGPGESAYADLPVLDMGQALTRYHISLDVADRPGVLAQVASAFADHEVSIETVRPAGRWRRCRRCRERLGRVDRAGKLVVVTHVAPEAALSATVDALAALPSFDVVPSCVWKELTWPTSGAGSSASMPIGCRCSPGPRSSPSTRAAPRSSPREALGARRRAGVREVRGPQPDRVVQGPRHDDGHLGGAARGAKAVICASTGNTSASAAAYATKAGMTCAVLVPDGKIAMGKLSQAIAHGATLLQVEGNFDDCLTVARKLAEAYPVELVNSVNPARIEGQKTAAFEIVDALGDAPDIHCLPVGNAGNITAYWQGYRSTPRDPRRSRRGGRPGHPRPDVGLPGRRRGADRPRPPGRRARDHRHRHPDRQPGLVGAGRGGPRRLRRPDRRGHRRADPRRPPDPVSGEGVFVEPGSAASVAGLLARSESGDVPAGARIVCTVTGHGLKDPQWALKRADGTEVVPTGSPPRRMPRPSPSGLES
jgi:threonine synthase